MSCFKTQKQDSGRWTKIAEYTWHLVCTMQSLFTFQNPAFAVLILHVTYTLQCPASVEYTWHLVCTMQPLFTFQNPDFAVLILHMTYTLQCIFQNLLFDMVRIFGLSIYPVVHDQALARWRLILLNFNFFCPVKIKTQVEATIRSHLLLQGNSCR